jgi:hypothetical protein
MVKQFRVVGERAAVALFPTQNGENYTSGSGSPDDAVMLCCFVLSLAPACDHYHAYLLDSSSERRHAFRQHSFRKLASAADQE